MFLRSIGQHRPKSRSILALELVTRVLHVGQMSTVVGPGLVFMYLARTRGKGRIAGGRSLPEEGGKILIFVVGM